VIENNLNSNGKLYE